MIKVGVLLYYLYILCGFRNGKYVNPCPYAQPLSRWFLQVL